MESEESWVENVLENADRALVQEHAAAHLLPELARIVVQYFGAVNIQRGRDRHTSSFCEIDSEGSPVRVLAYDTIVVGDRVLATFPSLQSVLVDLAAGLDGSFIVLHARAMHQVLKDRTVIALAMNSLPNASLWVSPDNQIRHGAREIAEAMPRTYKDFVAPLRLALSFETLEAEYAGKVWSLKVTKPWIDNDCFASVAVGRGRILICKANQWLLLECLEEQDADTLRVEWVLFQTHYGGDAIVEPQNQCRIFDVLDPALPADAHTAKRHHSRILSTSMDNVKLAPPAKPRAVTPAKRRYVENLQQPQPVLCAIS